MSFILNKPAERQLSEHLPTFQTCFLRIYFSDEEHENLFGCGLKFRAQELTLNPQNQNFRGKDLGLFILTTPPTHPGNFTT